MKIAERHLRRMVREQLVVRTRRLAEADIEELSDICYFAGSTHTVATCKLRGDKYYLKFSDEDLFDYTDPSLQVLIEYLAYRIYGLYTGVTIPKPELVYDRAGKRVGLATTPAGGRPITSYDPERVKFGRAMSAGVYVDVFLANWDVVGTGTPNAFLDDEKEVATRIDPGGSMTFRAQGGKKGAKFSKTAGELKTMLDPQFGGSGRIYQYSDLVLAGKEFLRVPWSKIQEEIIATEQDVTAKLVEKGLQRLADSWKEDVSVILDTLAARHVEVAAHAKMILDGGI